MTFIAQAHTRITAIFSVAATTKDYNTCDGLLSKQICRKRINASVNYGSYGNHITISMSTCWSADASTFFGFGRR